ncbi:protein of unknown function [Denitratisoma oestradiolicum]|uniref:Uncharacterized protein n=1 Tax=Denitratisoma oestradiolicum TaxID=311182 RepID=A0A6S6XXN9_9PROT|nr:protein of unknown function [Denitratisoma oestradiolicum]
MTGVDVFRVFQCFLSAETGRISANADFRVAEDLPVPDSSGDDPGHRVWLPAHPVPTSA